MNRLRWIGYALPSALALSVLALGIYFKNRYNVYPLQVLTHGPLILAAVLPATLLVFWLGRPLWRKIPVSGRRDILWIALALAPLTAWLISIPSPAVRAPHTLVIQPAEGSRVEVHTLTDLNRRPIPDSAIEMTSDWHKQGDIFYTDGNPGSRMAVQSDLAGGVVIGMRYFPEGGLVTLEWDGAARAVDLAARESLIPKTILEDSALQSVMRSPWPALLKLTLMALEVAGLFVLIFLCLVALFGLAGMKRARPTAAILIMVGLFAGFLSLKLSSLSADIPRTFRDTYAYVQIADLSLTDPQFWAGTRSFSLPLFLKLLGTTTSNYDSVEQMQRVFLAQVALSVLCWTVLAAVLAAVTPRRWLTRVFLFGLILFFSLSLEIGIWDALLLSESLTISLFALTLAAWLAMIAWLPNLRGAVWRWALLGGTVLITALYTFTRDSNVYFVVMGAGVLLLLWLRRQLAVRRSEAAVFAAAIAVLFLAQNLSLSAGNRWQIFMYDHLAARFLNDPEAVEFFAREGLPVSDRLMETRHMVGYVYQPIYMEDPAFQPVRDWVAARGKGAYLKYLLSNPWATAIEPLRNASKLVWGSNLEYRSPVGGVIPAPARLSSITALVYQRNPFVLSALFLAALAGIYIYRRDSNPLWALLVLLLVSLYPMMFIVWHGEPLEVERHAVQLGIQFRLVGWLGIAEIASAGLYRVFGAGKSFSPTG